MHNPLSRLYVVVPAAGTGQRMGSAVPKQYLELSSGQTVLGLWTVAKLQTASPGPVGGRAACRRHVV